MKIKEIVFIFLVAFWCTCTFTISTKRALSFPFIPSGLNKKIAWSLGILGATSIGYFLYKKISRENLFWLLSRPAKELSKTKAWSLLFSSDAENQKLFESYPEDKKRALLHGALHTNRNKLLSNFPSSFTLRPEMIRYLDLKEIEAFCQCLDKEINFQTTKKVSSLTDLSAFNPEQKKTLILLYKALHKNHLLMQYKVEDCITAEKENAIRRCTNDFLYSIEELEEEQEKYRAHLNEKIKNLEDFIFAYKIKIPEKYSFTLERKRLIYKEEKRVYEKEKEESDKDALHKAIEAIETLKGEKKETYKDLPDHEIIAKITLKDRYNLSQRCNEVLKSLSESDIQRLPRTYINFFFNLWGEDYETRLFDRLSSDQKAIWRDLKISLFKDAIKKWAECPSYYFTFTRIMTHHCNSNDCYHRRYLLGNFIKPEEKSTDEYVRNLKGEAYIPFCKRKAMHIDPPYLASLTSDDLISPYYIFILYFHPF